MVVVCKYDDCKYQETLETSQIPKECPRCSGHWLEESEDYNLLQDQARLLVGCSFTCAKTQAQQFIKIDAAQKNCGRSDFEFIGDRKSYISGNHFCLSMDNGQLFVEDLGSTNGTFIGLVDQVPVSQKTILPDGGWLVLGQEAFLIEYLEEETSESMKKTLPEPLLIQKTPRCMECAKELKEPSPCVCEYCDTWNE